MGSPSTSVWDDWLAYIEEGRVIPIIGSEVLFVPDEKGNKVSVPWLIATRLADRLGVSTADIADDDPLNCVICRFLKQPGAERQRVYPRLQSVVKEANLPTPDSLRKLAQVRHFKLFVTTTFDTLLERALMEVRTGAAEGPLSIAYAPNHPEDLPATVAELDRPTVYHLMGRLSSVPDCALTEEDTLEFFYSLQAGEKRPQMLLDELRNKHLLLIGNRFPDWLARFFIRLARRSRLSGQREAAEMLADRISHRDSNLVLFLQHFSRPTEVYPAGGAAEFVDELHQRYMRLHPPGGGPSPGEAGPVGDGAGTGPGDDMLPKGAVFLSYARQDRDAVQRIHDALQEAGVDVWFDRRRLEAGDDFASKIRRNVKDCSLFVPVISATTRRRVEGFFRREWNLAVDRSTEFADGVPFIVPVAIDDTPESDEAQVPGKFLSAQWARLPGGQVTDEFTGRMVRLIRDYRKRQRN